MINASIVVPTRRYGGLDVLFNSVSKIQYNWPFELVLVDELFDYRHKEVLELIKNSKLKNIRYVRGICDGKWALARMANKSARESTGKYIFFISDYVSVPKSLLSIGVQRLKDNPRSILAMQYTSYKHPEISNPKGKISTYGTTPVFEKITRADNTLTYTSRNISEYLYSVSSREVSGYFAIDRDDFYYLNGFDVIFDTTGAYQDEDFMKRARDAGIHFLVDSRIMLKRFRNSDYTDKELYGIPVDKIFIDNATKAGQELIMKKGWNVRLDSHLGLFDRRGWRVKHIVADTEHYTKIMPSLTKCGYTVHCSDILENGTEIINAVVFAEHGDFRITDSNVLCPSGVCLKFPRDMDKLNQEIQNMENVSRITINRRSE